MILLLLLVPSALGGIAWAVGRRPITRAVLLGAAAFELGAVAAAWAGMDFGGAAGSYLGLDSIGLVFLTIMALVFAGAALAVPGFFQESGASPRKEAVFVAELLVFLAAMTGVILARHLALLWVFVEATTLSSALLIYSEKKKSSLEAAWKYVFICSVGIALAFVGIILLSIGSRSVDSLLFSDLAARAGEINPFWLKLAFAFILVGFGTKMGVAPIHAWLPDAHAEAPSPVSALLSGALLNASFLGIARVQDIMVKAGLGAFSNTLLIVCGFLSLLVAAAYLLQVVNYKRMLAYSSIENMGILCLGLAFGPPGLFAALLHSAAHSLSKAAMFLTSGNILGLYGSKAIGDVRGLIVREPRTGWIWIVSFLAVAGFPPFPAFISKFLLIQVFFAAGSGWMAGPFLALIAVIVFGLGSAVFKMAFGDPPEAVPASALSWKPDVSAVVPQIVFLLILLGLGLSLPETVRSVLRTAAGLGG